MTRRFTAAIAALAALAAILVAAPVHAASRKPLVIGPLGTDQQIQAGDTLLTPAPATDGSLILTPGSAPSAPSNGACWTTTAGLYCQIAGGTVGPYGIGTGSGTLTPTGSPASGELAKWSGSTSLTNGDLSGDCSTSGTLVVTCSLPINHLAAIAAFDIVANPTSGSAAPIATSLSAEIDAALGSTRGSILERGASGWQIVVPGTSGYAWVSQGTGADPIYTNVGSGSSPYCVIGSTTACIYIGAGPPTVCAPEGSLYLRTDVSLAYRMWLPACSRNPALVQTAFSPYDSYVTTLGSTPVAGNYLITEVFALSSSPTLATGWTALLSHTSAGTWDPYAILAYHLVTTADTTSQTPASGGSAGVGAAIVEVSGLDMININHSIQYSDVQANVNGAGPTTTSTTTTTTTNTLGIGFAAEEVNFGNGVYTMGGPGGCHLNWNAGWTATYSTGPSGSTPSSFSMIGAQTFAGSSSSVTLTATGSTYFGVGNGLTFFLVVFQPAAAGPDVGWQPMSDLTSVYSNSTLVTAGARSLNFTPDFTITNDGSGNLTVDMVGVPAFISGTPATGNCVKWASSTTVTDTGTPCGSGGGGGANLVSPQGRLTLTSGTPVMSADATVQGTIYYDCQTGKTVPYYTGSADSTLSISGCEVSTALETSGTGVQNASDVFDVFGVDISSSLVLCVATNGSGGGWSSDTGGSTTARGSGYSQLHNSRGYWTNVNSIAHCYNGATDEGSIGADKGTYLGSFYTTAAGKTGMAFAPSAAGGGAAPILGLWNAYNRVLVGTISRDSTTSWTYNSTSWRKADNNAGNRASYVDGLGMSTVETRYGVTVCCVSGAGVVGVSEDSTSAAPRLAAFNGLNSASGLGIALSAHDSYAPAIGFHFLQAMEADGNSSTTTYQTNPGTPSVQIQALVINLEM